MVRLDRKKIKTICQENDISSMAIFGSYARGDFKKGSDLDLLVKFKKTKSLLELIRIEKKLQKIFEKKIDLLTPSGISPYIYPFIKRDLKVIYEA